jgi:hypothetical protein
MIDLSWIQTLPAWVATLISALLGAVVGGLASSLGSYMIEKEKWRAEAAILRKDQVYSPVYDELALLVDKLKSEDGWLSVSPRRTLEKWREVSHTGIALEVPEAFAQRLDRFVELCDEYAAADRRLVEQIIEAFPGRHFGLDDWGIARNLVGRMLLELPDDYEVLEYLRKQRPSERVDWSAHWTAGKFVETRKAIESLSEWPRTKKLHSEYVEDLRSVYDELGKCIRRIAKKYQRAAPDL